jgi:hypothetical protein
MAVNFADVLLAPNYEFWGRPITITPLVSQPGAGAYSRTGIFGSGPIMYQAEDGSVIGDQQTRVDVRDADFTVLPVQGDQIDIPTDSASLASPLGSFEIVNTENDGGGETTLILRKLYPPTPVVTPFK